MAFDAIELEVLWQSLIAPSTNRPRHCNVPRSVPIVREAGDLANALFDRRGRMVAQAVTGTPGHINSLAARRDGDARGVPARRRSSRATCSITNDPYKTAGQLLDVTVLVPVWRDGQDRRLLRFDDPPHRRRRLRHRRRCARRVRGGLVDPDLQADEARASATTTCGSSSSPTCASPTTWRATCTPRWRRARSARSGCNQLLRRATVSTTSRTSPTRSSGAREEATRRAIRALPGGTYRGHADARPRRRLADRDRRRHHRRPGKRRDPRRLRGLVGRQPVRHQRREELHARLHDVHGAQRAQPRGAEQPRQPGADQGRGARGQHRQRRVARAVHRAPRRRHVPADAVAAGARADACRSRRMAEGSGAVWTCRCRATTTTADRSSRRCSPTRAASAPGPTSPACRRRRTPPASPPCRSRSSRRRRRCCFLRKELRAGCGGEGRRARRHRPDDRVHRRHRPRPGSSTR